MFLLLHLLLLLLLKPIPYQAKVREKFGNIGTWGSQDVLVLDGLSRLSQAAMDQQLAPSGNISKYGSQDEILDNLW